MHVTQAGRHGLRIAALIAATAALTACGGRHKETVKADLPADIDKVVEIRFPPPTAVDGQGRYRFNMQQGEQKMTADEFEAWMQANGFRVAKGRAAGADAATR